MTRHDGRAADALRPITFQAGIAPHAAGSVLVGFGNTRVICAASVHEEVPRWMKDQKVPGGWLTAEYSMLPYSTLDRKAREISRGKPDSRGTEIQRLIGRSLRASICLESLGPRTIWLDCDVLQADGGTRTAAITGASLALEMACHTLVRAGKLSETPFRRRVAAVSCGLQEGQALLDLDYVEDRDIDVDLNLVLTQEMEIVEVQASAEGRAFTGLQLDALLEIGRKGVTELFRYQSSEFEKFSHS